MSGDPGATPERHVLRDGTSVFVRALRPADAELITMGMQHMSDESRYRRFMAATESLSAADLDRFSHPDGVDHVAFGASDPAATGPAGRLEGLGIGTARYFRSADDPTTAEFAVAVIDEYRHRGVATLLLDHLTRHARANGVERFTAEFLAQNQPIIELIQGRGGTVAIVPEDRTVMTAALPLTGRVP